MQKYARIQEGVVVETLETDGDIAEMFHPSLLWVDVTLAEDVAEGWGYNAGNFSPPDTGASIADIKAARIAAVQAHMDAAARTFGYDDIKTAVTYADEPAVLKFQAEGQALRAWRSLVWAKCYEILAEVESGVRGVPTDAELMDALPALVLA